MTTQLDLGLADKAPKVTAQEIAIFCEELCGKGWQTSEQLGATTPQQKRHLRAMSEASDGRIVSFPGSPGYKLFDECVPEEFAHADRATRSGIRKQLVKLTAIMRRMHARGIVFPSGYAQEPIE